MQRLRWYELVSICADTGSSGLKRSKDHEHPKLQFITLLPTVQDYCLNFHVLPQRKYLYNQYLHLPLYIFQTHHRVHFLNGLFIKISESVLPPRLQRPQEDSIPVNSNLARCLAHNLYLKHRWTKARYGIELHKRAGLGHEKVNFSDIAHERSMAFM